MAEVGCLPLFSRLTPAASRRGANGTKWDGQGDAAGKCPCGMAAPPKDCLARAGNPLDEVSYLVNRPKT